MAKAPRRGPYICGIDAALDVVSGKWKGLILWELNAHRVRRFAALRRGLPGVSEKMLTQHLREMEADGLVLRQVYAEVPPRVEYSLTEHGRMLNEALGALGAWGTERIRREGFETVDVAETSSGSDRLQAPPGGDG
ncbi:MULTISPECIES: winged helix-turn-helix transcriptional regulator [unclassified Streptomyces]|uniref:winged helix-turn-helix transcriptional regulator n=1 Tax=unclassified Streptomyces TaxID=2593676 RepID=UPI00331DC288